MIKFLEGLKAAINAKPVSKDQILFSKDTGELQIDLSDGNSTTRYSVKDPLAQSLDGKTILIL